MPRTWFLNTILHSNESGLPEEMADFRDGEAKVQVQPGTMCYARL